ncbi:YoaK family protein [Sphingomonas sp. BK580]|uniref:YoaK family protein n=1 Tax=Sphingomonas sp. BK580 TaxID=2586972 RepID=UPI00160E35A7|nr:YoaK family protein [Sphingomonas sp. BK580]MBB3695271.1 uncharacterized membrane protein YoaK (UPF0700 family) [Sphingomonas sp. BK580]
MIEPELQPLGRGAATWGAIALIAFAGAVDAVGFLQMRLFYVSFMSGNTTRAAVAVVEGDMRLALYGAAIIALFVAGVALGEVLTGVPPRRRRLTMSCEAVLLAAGYASGGFWSLAPLVIAMGMHNALVLRIQGVGAAMTYVTGTLVHLGRGLAARMGVGSSTKVWPYLLSWTALALGGVMGGLLFESVGSSSLLALALLLLLAAFTPRSL